MAAELPHSPRRATARGRFAVAALAALVALMLAAALAGCGKSSGSSVPPDKRVKTALANAAQIKSGVSQIDGTVALGNLPGSLKVTGGGPFDAAAPKGGAANITFSTEIAGRSVALGMLTVGGKSYTVINGKAFENKQGAAGGAGIDPQAVSATLVSLSGYVTGAKSIGTKTVDGTKLDMYSFKVDMQALAKKELDKKGAGDVSVPGIGSLKDLAQRLGTADLTIGVGADDLPHQFGANVSLGATGQQSGGIKGTVTLTNINKPVTISEPTNVVSGSGLDGIGGMLGGLGG